MNNLFIKNSPSYPVMGVSFDIKADDIEDSGKFKGWGSTFGGSPDSYGDIVVKGAFKDTIANGGRNRNGIAMLYQHNPGKPIGVWTKLEELDKGLYVEGQLILEAQTAKEAFVLMREGAIKGLSIGYDIPRLENGIRDPDAYEIVEKGDSYVRFLKKLELWEISLVTFPANIGANITNVKDFENCRTERDWERALREAGLTNAQAKMVVKQIKPSLREAEEKDDAADEEEFAKMLLQGLQKRNEKLYN